MPQFSFALITAISVFSLDTLFEESRGVGPCGDTFSTAEEQREVGGWDRVLIQVFTHTKMCAVNNAAT